MSRPPAPPDCTVLIETFSGTTPLEALTALAKTALAVDQPTARTRIDAYQLEFSLGHEPLLGLF